MSYRDDHEASLARADALSRQLAQAEAALAQVVAERDRLRVNLDYLSLMSHPRPLARRDWNGWLFAGVGFVWLLSAVFGGRS